MRIKQGYVFVVNFDMNSLLFGPSISHGNAFFDSIETNELTFYESRGEASRDLGLATEHYFKHLKGPESGVREISMRITETEEDVPRLKNKDLIIILEGEGMLGKHTLIGPRVINRIDFCNGVGARLRYNGLKTFNKLGYCYTPDTALYCQREVARQCQAKTHLANFCLGSNLGGVTC